MRSPRLIPAGLYLRILLIAILVALLGLLPQPAALTSALEAAGWSGGNAAALRLVARLQPWRKGIWEQVGRLELEAGNPDQALQALELARQRNELTLAGEFSLGEAYRLTGDLSHAEMTWQSLLESDQPPPETYSHLFALQRSQGRLDAALNTLIAWHRQQPQEPQAAFQLGLFWLVDQPEQAETLFDLARGANPGVSAQVDRLKGALYQAENAENEGDRLLILGRALANLGQWDLAQPAFEKAVQSSPQYAEAWAFLGETRQQLGGDGWPALQKAQALDPGSVIVQALLALYWRRQGQPELALAYLDQISRLEPDQPVWQVELGYTLAERGDLVSASDHFQRATLLQPTNPVYWQVLARFCVENSYQVRQLGLPAARQALMLSPNDPLTLDLLGRVLFSLEDLPTSERFLQLALQKDAGYAPAHLHLGQLYLASGAENQARYHLTLAAKLAGKTDPVGLAARRMLTRYFGGGG